MTGFFGRSAPLFGCVLSAAIGLTGCSTEVPYKAPGFPFVRSYHNAQHGNPVLLSNVAWWKGFKDPTLDALITRAFSGNLSLELAKERVTQAQANLQSISSNASVSPSASVRRQRRVDSPTETRSEAALGFSWMFDPYGARRQRVNAASARIEVADAEVDAARLLLLFNIANTYVDLRYNQRILQLRQQNLRSRRKTFALTQRLFDQRSATRLDIVRTEALVAETMAQIPTLRAAVRNRKYELAVLVGTTIENLKIDLDSSARQPRPKMSPDVGIPADLLRNRPDIRIAERLYYASVADIGSAKADLYPRLSLGGSIGLASIRNGSSGSEYFFGPSVQFPSLLNGDRKAVVAGRYSLARQAHTSWKSNVLQAILEVETSLLNYSASGASVQAAHRTSRLYREAANLTRDLVERDSATIRDLIDAEEQIADADAVLAENMRQLGRNFVSLNVSLGSGNSSDDQQAEVTPSNSAVLN